MNNSPEKFWWEEGLHEVMCRCSECEEDLKIRMEEREAEKRKVTREDLSK